MREKTHRERKRNNGVRKEDQKRPNNTKSNTQSSCCERNMGVCCFKRWFAAWCVKVEVGREKLLKDRLRGA